MERKVSFYSDGIKIGALLWEPENAPDNGCPGLVLCPTMSGHKEHCWFPDFAERFLAMGGVALSFDFRGIGDSEGESGRLFPLENSGDIRNALTYLENHPKVDPDRLGLYGSSWGGGMVPYVAGVDKRVKAGISSVGWADGTRWMRDLRRHVEWLEFLDRLAEDRKNRVLTGATHGFGPGEILMAHLQSPQISESVRKIHANIPRMETYSITPWSLASAEKLMEFNPIDVVDRISPRAMLYIAAENDTICPADHVVDMYQRTNGPKKLWLIPKALHHAVYEKPMVDQGSIPGPIEGLDELVAFVERLVVTDNAGQASNIEHLEKLLSGTSQAEDENRFTIDLADLPATLKGPPRVYLLTCSIWPRLRL